jgi:hypothetical protein
MYEYEVVRAMMDERIRQAEHQRQARGLRRREASSPARSAARVPRRHSRLWALVHPRQAYS